MNATNTPAEFEAAVVRSASERVERWQASYPERRATVLYLLRVKGLTLGTRAALETLLIDRRAIAADRRLIARGGRRGGDNA